jgi:hypothetical protein
MLTIQPQFGITVLLYSVGHEVLMSVAMKIAFFFAGGNCNTYQFRESPTFWKNISHPSSGSKDKPCKKPPEEDVKQLVSSLAYPLTLKMETICSFETLFAFRKYLGSYLTTKEKLN